MSGKKTRKRLVQPTPLHPVSHDPDETRPPYPGTVTLEDQAAFAMNSLTVLGGFLVRANVHGLEHDELKAAGSLLVWARVFLETLDPEGVALELDAGRFALAPTQFSDIERIVCVRCEAGKQGTERLKKAQSTTLAGKED